MNPIIQQQSQKQPQIQNLPNNEMMEKIKMVYKMVGNRNPKDVFYSLCKQKGVDPNQILEMLKQ